MARKSLRSQLNQIRSWVRQDRTNAWIAHQLEVSTDEIVKFKKEHNLIPGEKPPPIPPPLGLESETELDAAGRAAAPKSKEEAKSKGKAGGEGTAGERKPGRTTKRRRRGRGRAKAESRMYEATFDHGEAGYGVWLDPAIVDDPIYADNWAGHRSITVRIEADAIIFERAEPDED